jgi:hypothetical protein
VAVTALRQANNGLNNAVQLLQEEPELLQLASEERAGEELLAEPSDEMLATVVSLGYDPEMARAALRRAGTVEGAVEELVEGGGVIQVCEEAGFITVLL